MLLVLRERAMARVFLSYCEALPIRRREIATKRRLTPDELLRLYLRPGSRLDSQSAILRNNSSIRLSS
jgi:hypothetical protein